MCGRYVLEPDDEEHFFENFGAALSAELFPHGVVSYNLAPTQAIPVVVASEEGRAARPMHWGLIPSWAKDRKMAAKMINARSETVAEKPSFRQAFGRRRALVPASGWYEWRRPEKTPFYFKRRDGAPLTFAGLWEEWSDHESGEVIESCTILTQAASEAFAEYHHRMPLILDADGAAEWLAEDFDKERLDALRERCDATELAGFQVSPDVGRVANNRPELIAPAAQRRQFD